MDINSVGKLILMDKSITYFCKGCREQKVSNIRSKYWKVYCNKTKKEESMILSIGRVW